MSGVILIIFISMAFLPPNYSLNATTFHNFTGGEGNYTDWSDKILSDMLATFQSRDSDAPNSLPGSHTNNNSGEIIAALDTKQQSYGPNNNGCNKKKGWDYGFKDGGLFNSLKAKGKVPVSTNGSQCVNKTEYNATYTDKRSVSYIWAYGSPVIMVIGTFGNVLSFIVMCRTKIRESTTSLYLRVLAVVDTTVLYTGLLQLWIKNYKTVDIRLMSNAACKFQMFYGYFILQLESWILATVTLERLFAVLKPASFKSIFSRRNAMLGLWVKVFIGFAINVHFFFTHSLDNVFNTTALACTATGDYRRFMQIIWPWLDMCLASLLPSCIIVFSNVAIFARVVYSRYGGHHPPTSSSTQIGPLTGTLMMVSLSFFLTTAPITFYLISVQNKLSEEEKEGTTWALLNMLMYTNNAINFLLYVIGGQRFRKELVGMFCRTNVVTPSENGS